MEGSCVTYQSRGRRPAGYALIEILIGCAAAGGRVLSRMVAAIAKFRRRELMRRELHGLSNHVLRDIGLDRSRIDRLFD